MSTFLASLQQESRQFGLVRISLPFMSPVSNCPSTGTFTLLVDSKPHVLCLDLSSVSLFHCNRVELHCNNLDYYHFNTCKNSVSFTAETPVPAVLVKVAPAEVLAGAGWEGQWPRSPGRFRRRFRPACRVSADLAGRPSTARGSRAGTGPSPGRGGLPVLCRSSVCLVRAPLPRLLPPACLSLLPGTSAC